VKVAVTSAEVCPADRLDVPRTVAPSKNVTVPDGIELPSLVDTEAVSWVDWPSTVGLGHAVTDVVTTAEDGSTSTVTVEETDESKVAFPR
jgi:hypothetical protein